MIETKTEAAFWRFIYERQRAFERRRKGLPPPWTDDPVISKHRFTNVYRAADRVSQYLIDQVLHTPVRQQKASGDPAEMAFRAVLFRMFNQPVTYALLREGLGYEHPSLANWGIERYTRILDQAIGQGFAIWNNAYMITPPPDTYGTGEGKHAGWLRILNRMVKDGSFKYIAGCASRQAIYTRLLSYNTVGSFFAYQWTTDIGYADMPGLLMTDADENSFCVPGGGAKRGVRKLVGSEHHSDWFIADAVAAQEEQFIDIGVDFPWLANSRRLHAIDIQNCLCEFDKWTREAMPGLQVGKAYGHIKQGYDSKRAEPPIQVYCWPPSWELPSVW